MTTRVEPAVQTPGAPVPGAPVPPASALGARARFWLAAASGLLATVVTLAVAEILAVFVGSSSSPLFAVGSWIVDLAPPGFK